MKFCPECGANWQNQYSDTCAACGYKLPQAMSAPAAAAPTAYAPPVQPTTQSGDASAPQQPGGQYTAPTATPYAGQQPLPQKAPGPLPPPAPLFGQEALQQANAAQVPPSANAPVLQNTGPIAPAPSAPSLFNEELNRAVPPAGGAPAPLFQDTAIISPPPGAPPLFGEEMDLVAPSPPPQQQRSVAAKAANLQALLEAEDNAPAFQPTPPPARGRDMQDTRPYQRTHYEESYEDDYEQSPPSRKRSGGGNRGRDDSRDHSNRSRDDRGRDDRGRGEPPPRRPRDNYENGYDAPDPRRGGKNSGNGGARSKGLVILAIVLAVAVVATLIFAVLYLGGFLGGGGASPETSSASAPISTSNATPETQVSSSASDFAAQLTTSEINDVISEFYQSYLQCINAEDLAPLTRATELCRGEVETRIGKSFNKENQFNYLGVACDEQSIQYGEDNGRPAIICNAKFEYSYRPKADTAAEYTNGSNYQTIQLVYEQYQWKVNRFVMIDASEFENHTVASFT